MPGSPVAQRAEQSRASGQASFDTRSARAPAGDAATQRRGDAEDAACRRRAARAAPPSAATSAATTTTPRRRRSAAAPRRAGVSWRVPVPAAVQRTPTPTLTHTRMLSRRARWLVLFLFSGTRTPDASYARRRHASDPVRQQTGTPARRHPWSPARRYLPGDVHEMPGARRHTLLPLRPLRPLRPPRQPWHPARDARDARDARREALAMAQASTALPRCLPAQAVTSGSVEL